MPIIINEIEISVAVADDNTAGSVPPVDNIVRQEIIKECVEQIVEIFSRKNER